MPERSQTKVLQRGNRRSVPNKFSVCLTISRNWSTYRDQSSAKSRDGHAFSSWSYSMGQPVIVSEENSRWKKPQGKRVYSIYWLIGTACKHCSVPKACLLVYTPLIRMEEYMGVVQYASESTLTRHTPALKPEHVAGVPNSCSLCVTNHVYIIATLVRF